MSKYFPNLFSPIMIGKVEVRNRIVFPPTTTNYATAGGEVSDLMVDHYARIAKGGVGLIIVENAQIKYPEGKNVARQLRIDDDKYIAGYFALAEAAHLYGAKIFQQIHHAGRQTNKEISEGEGPVAPSPIPCGFMQVMPKELTKDEIKDLVERFAHAALRVKKAGMDGVELHGAHGYLIGQFMSPHTNKRTDEYGGSFENRMRFILEIIEKIRELCGPDFPICVRYSADELVPDGINLEEGKKIAKTLEEVGVDILHISCAIYETLPACLEPMYYDEGWRVYMAEEIKKEVKIPVITVGQIRKPEFAEEVVKNGRADMVAISRGLIADPDWPNKAKEGKVSEIRRCISCNIGCIGGHVFADLLMRCTVNPEIGRRKEYIEIKPAEKKKKVLVVGGGPGGMKAAEIAKIRGHDVVLYEKSDNLGGMLIPASASPGKERIIWPKEDLERKIKGLGVEVICGKEVTEADIDSIKPDEVILATGSIPIIPDIPGKDRPNVYLAHEVLMGKEVSGENVIVVGAGMVGVETCVYLCEKKGKKVTLVTRRTAEYSLMDGPGVDMEPITRFMLFTTKWPKLGVNIVPFSTYDEVVENGLWVKDKEGNRNLIEGDAVVFALGYLPNRSLYEKIKDKYSCHLIGDALSPRKIIDAIREGFMVAKDI